MNNANCFYALFSTYSFQNANHYYMMNTLSEVGETQKEKFERRLTEVIKTNYSIVSNTQYDEIIRYLKADDKSSFQRKLKRKVKANNYSLISFLSLGIHDFFCVPVSGAEKVNVFDYFIIIFLMHSSVDKGLKDTKYRLDLAISNAGSTKYKLDPIFKGTTTFLKKNFMAPFYGWGSSASRLEPFRGGSLLFTTKFPEIPGIHFVDLGRMKG